MRLVYDYGNVLQTFNSRAIESMYREKEKKKIAFHLLKQARL